MEICNDFQLALAGLVDSYDTRPFVGKKHSVPRPRKPKAVEALKTLTMPSGLQVTLMPARRIVTGSGARVRGIYPSHRYGHPIHWEAPTERDLLHVLEFSRLTSNVIHQPSRLKFTFADRVIDYTPDYLVLGSLMEPAIAECKPKKFLQLQAISDRLAEIREVFDVLGMRFVVVDETKFANPTLWENVHKLRSAQAPRRRAPYDAKVNDVLRALDFTTFGELALLVGQSTGLQLIADGKYGFDLRQQLTGSTQISQTIQEECDVATFLFS